METADALEAAKAAEEVIVVFFGEDNEDFSAWEKLCRTFDDLTFYHVFDSGVASEYGAESLAGVTVSDVIHGEKHEQMSSEERELGLKTMVEITLESL